MENIDIISIVVPLSLMVIMFGMGLSLSAEDFRRIIVFPRAVLIGSVAQILLLPATGFACALLFDLTGEMAVGLVILSACAGGVTSNMLSYLARADVALSVTLTAISSCVTIITVPLIVNLALRYFMSSAADIQLPVQRTVLSLLVVTVLPVAAGMVVHRKFSGFATRAEPIIKRISVVVLFTIILSTVFIARDLAMESLATVGPATYLLNILCMATGYFLSRLFRLTAQQSSSIVIEVGVQNIVTAIFVASTLLQAPGMALPAAIYSLPMFLNACTYVALRRKKVARA